jgi:hypothetical protein
MVQKENDDEIDYEEQPCTMMASPQHNESMQKEDNFYLQKQ